MDFKNIKEKKDFHSDEMILEIGTKRTNFYSYWARLRAERMDSLQKIGITDPWALQAHLGDIPRSFSCITSIQTILKPKSKLSQFVNIVN